MGIDKSYFFDVYKEEFKGIKQPQVEAYDELLDEFDASLVFDTKGKISYGLATVKHETGDTGRPVEEGYWIKNRIPALYNYYVRNNPAALKTIFPNGKNGKNYLGRGLPQITHNYNYKNVGDGIGVDLLNNPELAMHPDIAFKIMEYGMHHGTFTGKKLNDYFKNGTYDFYNSRAIINGDKKKNGMLIAGYASVFFKAIRFV